MLNTQVIAQNKRVLIFVAVFSVAALTLLLAQIIASADVVVFEAENTQTSINPESDPHASNGEYVVFETVNDPPPTLSCNLISQDQVGWNAYKNQNGESDNDLTVSSGVLTISTEGAIIERINHTGRVVIIADNVTLRQSVINGSGSPSFMIESNGQNLIIEDTELNGDNNAVNLVGRGNYTLKRVYAHSSRADAFKTQEHNVVIENVWAWNPTPGPGAHADAVQTQGGDNITVSCSNLDWRYRGGDFGAVENPTANAANGGFQGQGFWATNGSNNVSIRDTFVGAMGFPIGANGSNWELCNLTITSSQFSDNIHPSNNNVNIIKWSNIFNLNGGVVSIPSSFTNVSDC